MVPHKKVPWSNPFQESLFNPCVTTKLKVCPRFTVHHQALIEYFHAFASEFEANIEE